MLNIVRRGPASSATLIFSRSFSSKCIRGVRLRDVQQCIARTAHLNAIRPFGTAIQWRRSATAAAEYEDEAIEAEIEQEVGAEEPPPDTQIKRPVDYGPVTEFQELADRGMVSDTVVRTLTRDMGLKTMTAVQSMTINETLKGIDVYV
jgi:ATP-dependent RNA helicase MSS116